MTHGAVIVDETILYARLRTHIEEWGACSRVENIVEGGMFDIFYCIEGRMGWIETKIEHNGKILFERFQFPWARKYQRVGARLFVIVQLKNGDIAIYPIDEILKAPREQYQKWLRLNISDLAAIDILSKPFYWARLRQVLVS
jgi:hypothetical protein